MLQSVRALRHAAVAERVLIVIGGLLARYCVATQIFHGWAVVDSIIGIPLPLPLVYFQLPYRLGIPYLFFLTQRHGRSPIQNKDINPKPQKIIWSGLN